MTPEQFIVDNIFRHMIVDDHLKTEITESALRKYQRNQFDSVTELIQSHRKLLLVRSGLNKGITVKEYSQKHNISYDSALRFLRHQACARYKNASGSWVYRA